MGTSQIALPESEPQFVLINLEEPFVDCTDKPYALWAPTNMTCLEEMQLLIMWATSKHKIPDPIELLENMRCHNFPVTLGWLATFETQQISQVA